MRGLQRITFAVLAALPAFVSQARASQQPPQQRVISSETLLASLAISKDGALVASLDNDCKLKVWNARTGALVRKFADSVKPAAEGPGLMQVVFSPDGKELATADGSAGSFSLWTLASWKKRITVKTQLKNVRAIAYSPDGKTLVTVGSEPGVKLWETSGKEVRSIATESSLSKVIFSSDGKQVIATGGGPVYVWAADTGELAQTLKAYYANKSSTWSAVAISRDGKRIAMGGSPNEVTEKAPIEIWDVASGKVEQTLPGHSGNITALLFRADGKTLISAGLLDSVAFWDIATGKESMTVEGGAYSLAASADGYVLAWTKGREINIWSGK